MRPKQMAHKSSSRKSINKNGYMDRRWMLNIPNEEDEAFLYVSTHSWTTRGVWCGKMEKVEAITHFVHPIGEA